MRNFVKGLGGIEQAKAALAWFREATAASGFPGLHLQCALRQELMDKVDGHSTIYELLGFDSGTHYQFVQMTHVAHSYPEVLADSEKLWYHFSETLPFPYYAHVSVGWDNNPRFIQRHGPEMADTTPANIKQGFLAARKYADAHPQQIPLITVNSWNEWTETSYLEPDDLNGYGYLEALRDVFDGRE